MFKRVGSLGALVVALGLVAGCGSDGDEGASTAAAATPAKADGKPLVLANITDEAYPGADWTVFRKASEAAAKYINEELGGFGGRPLEVWTCDSKLNPAATQACANEAIQKGAFAEHGVSTQWGQVGLPIFSKAKLPSFNAPTDNIEFSHEWSFPVSAGSIGERYGQARYICSLKPQRVTILVNDLPSSKVTSDLLHEYFDKCGVKASTIFTNPTAADYSADVAKAVRSKPDYISIAYGNKTNLLVYKALQAAGFPAEKVATVGGTLDTDQFLSLAGDTANGTFMSYEFAPWSETSNADVKTYRDAMEKYDGGSPEGMFQQWAFANVMTIYNAAKAIGFDKFDAATLTEHLRTAPKIPVFMGKEMVNPAPNSEYPSIRQPFVRIVQWKDGEVLDLVGGWYDPFA